MKNARTAVKQYLGLEPEEAESEDEDAGGAEDVDLLDFGGDGARWEVSDNLKTRLKGAFHVAVDAFFSAL